MFQITDEYPVLHQRMMGWSVFASLFALSMTYIWPLEIVKIFSIGILAVCLIVFSLTTLWVLHKRRRQLADTTMRFWQLAMVSLSCLTLCWGIPTLMGMELPVFLLGVLMIHGFAMTTINGMMYKIIPFIIWLHLSVHNKNLRDKDKRDSQVKVPHMRKIIPEAAGLWQFRFHLVSLVLLMLATIWPLWFFYPAVILFASAQGFLLFNLLKAVHFYNTKVSELAAVI